MSNHRQSYRRADNNAESNDASDRADVSERVIPLRIATIQQRDVLCDLWMQQMEWMSLDDIEYDNIEDVLVVKDYMIRTP